jgi:hypothetical protein
MKLNLRGRLFDNAGEIQVKSQRVLDTLTERTFMKLSKIGGDGGAGSYMREENPSRLMVADRPCVVS